MPIFDFFCSKTLARTFFCISWSVFVSFTCLCMHWLCYHINLFSLIMLMIGKKNKIFPGLNRCQNNFFNIEWLQEVKLCQCLPFSRLREMKSQLSLTQKGREILKLAIWWIYMYSFFCMYENLFSIGLLNKNNYSYNVKYKKK